MKKLLSIITVVIVLLAFTGCGASDDAYNSVVAENEKLKQQINGESSSDEKSSDVSDMPKDDGEYLTELPGVKYKVGNFKLAEIKNGVTHNILKPHVSFVAQYYDNPETVKAFNGSFAADMLMAVLFEENEDVDRLSDTSLTQLKIGEQIAYCYTETINGETTRGTIVSLKTKYVVFANELAVITFQFSEPVGDAYEKNDAEFDKVIASIVVDPKYAVSEPEAPFDVNDIPLPTPRELQTSSVPSTPSKTEDKKPTTSKDTPSEPTTSSAPPVQSQTIGQKNAIAMAKSYLEHLAFSYQGLVEQLEYEKYSNADAVYAVDNCGANWNDQATKKAKSYLSHSSFSRESLIDQLLFEGFTHEQAVHGVTANGY